MRGRSLSRGLRSMSFARSLITLLGLFARMRVVRIGIHHVLRDVLARIGVATAGSESSIRRDLHQAIAIGSSGNSGNQSADRLSGGIDDALR